MNAFFWEKRCQFDADSNRELLLEFCVSNGLLIANTFFNHALVNQVTFGSVGTNRGTRFSADCYGQLDMVLARQCDFAKVVDVRSLVDEPLVTHH